VKKKIKKTPAVVKGKRAGKVRDSSHKGKKRSGRLVASSPKAKEVSKEKLRGQDFLKKLRAQGSAWWTDRAADTRCLITSEAPNADTYSRVLVVVGNKLRVGAIADKQGLLVCCTDGIHAFVPWKNVVGLVLETKKRM
jgi:hypothetical protein